MSQLVIGSTLRPERLNDYWATNPKSHETEINKYMTTPLMWTNNLGQLEPILSEFIPTIDNKNYFIEFDENNNPISSTVYFKIKDNAVWSDGNPITSDDVAFWLEVKKFNKTGIKNTEPWNNAEIKKIDSLNFKVRFDPFYLFADSNPGPGIAPKHIMYPLWKEYKNKVNSIEDKILINKLWVEFLENFTSPKNIIRISSGPFILEEWNTKYIKLYRNKNYNLSILNNILTDTSINFVESIIYRFYDDYTELLEGLENGEIDLVISSKISYQDAKKVCEVNSNLELEVIPTNNWEHIEVNKFQNNKHTIQLDLNIADIRKALLYGIDRMSIMKKIDGNLSEIAHNFIYPYSNIYFKDTKIYTYNPKKSIELFKKHGWNINNDGYLEKENKIFSLRIATNIEDSYRTSIQEMIAENWRRIGINAIVEQREASEIFDPEIFQKGENGTFDLLLFGWGGDPAFEKGELYTDEINGYSNIPSRESGYKGENIGAWSNVKYRELFNKCLLETNQELRKKMFEEMQQEWVEDLPTLPLYFRSLYMIKHKDLYNIRYNASSKYISWNSFEYGWRI